MSDLTTCTFRMSKDTLDKLNALSEFFNCSKTSVVDRCIRSAYSECIDNKEIYDLVEKMEDIKKQIDSIAFSL